jgi:WD40 repeat protein
VQLWNATDGRQTKTLKGNLSTVVQVAVSPDGTGLVSADGRWTRPSVVVWGLKDGKSRGRIDLPDGLPHALAFSPDGKSFLVGTGNGSVLLYDLESVDRVGADRLLTGSKEPAAVRGAAFSPDGRRFATAHEDGTVVLWDAAAFRELFVFRAHNAGTLRGVRFSPDGRRMATTGADGLVRYWDLGRIEREAGESR